MQNADETLKTLASTLDKYRKNKTLVPPEDLEGKYKVPFQKLKTQLHNELVDFIVSYSLGGLAVYEDADFDVFVRAVNGLYDSGNYKQQFGQAAFRDFDIDAVKRLAEELRLRIYNEAWVPYFQAHICLFVTAECLYKDSVSVPRIYNNLVNRFFDPETGKWTEDGASEKPALLIFVGGKK